MAVFVKKDIPVLAEGEVFVHHSVSLEETLKGGTSKNIQYITTEINDTKINIVNFHGLWNGKGKTDSDARLMQSSNIINTLKDLEGEIVLCGDFNLRPDTESLAMIENFGLRNLIKENGVTSTRTALYKKEEKFADYTLVSKGVTVREFKVLPDEVSDHNAMYLDFEV